jgi:glycosyltransferase involved in cell wall biosynthesis
MEKIKIVHILHAVGGVDISLRFIIENINTDGFENIIIHGKNDTEDSYKDRNSHLLKEYKVSIYRDISLIRDTLALINVYKIIKKERPNLIHCHSTKGGIIGRLVGFMLNINVLHTPQAFSFLSTDNFFKKRIYLIIEKIFKFKNSYLLASSISESKLAIHKVHYDEKKILLFNNSIKPLDSYSELIINKTWPDNYICTVGRPSYQKNIELMVRVLKEVNKSLDIHLVIMGVGHHSDKLETVKNLIKELGLEKSITLLDWTNRENVLNIIKHSKVYLSTARYEGLPYSVIEALALSKPCVVSDCDGNRDLIQNNYNGFVIQNEDIYEYSVKIKHLLNDNNLLNKLSANALISFNQNYNIKKNIKYLEQIYTDYSIK